MESNNDSESNDRPLEDIEDLEPPVKRKKSPRSNRSKKKKVTPRLRRRTDELIRSALEAHLEYQAVKSSSERKDIQLLGSILDEYLDNFIILGYNYHGDQVQLISASNQQQADALGTCMHRFIIKNTMPGPGSMFT